DDGTCRVGDRHDGVVERALDVRLPVGDVLAFLAPDLLDSGRAGASLRRHSLCAPRYVSGLDSKPVLLLVLLRARLLLAGDRSLRALGGARVGPGALTAQGQALAVPDTGVAADLDLAADVRGDLAAQVAFDLVVGLDVVAQLHDLFIGQVTSPLVRVDAGGGQ